MFRKDEAAAKSWESFKCDKCAAMQEPILESADRMLRHGGVLAYSTCTFSPEEDEMMIGRFIKRHPGYELLEIDKAAGITDGRPDWAGEYADPQLSKAARLWPHRINGEGHFVAKLRKGGGGSGSIDSGSIGSDALSYGSDALISGNTAFEESIAADELPMEFKSFINDNMKIGLDHSIFKGSFMRKGKNLYHLPICPPMLKGLKVAKFGWFLGELEGGRFEPSHSMLLALPAEALKRTVNLTSESREVLSYLKGETLMIEGEKGYTAVCVDGYTLGWAKQTGDNLKNLYPKGWRKMV
jgi:NOL1/NOP2/fmu family ribosome biogenesis protein